MDLDLNSELFFVDDDGTTEARGATRRWGIDFETRYQVFQWLYADFDLSFADPRFRTGKAKAVPLAPTLLMGGLTAQIQRQFLWFFALVLH